MPGIIVCRVPSTPAFDETTVRVGRDEGALVIFLRPRSGLSEEISVVASPLGDQNSPGSIAIEKEHPQGDQVAGARNFKGIGPVLDQVGGGTHRDGV